MQLRFFTISVYGSEDFPGDLNRFLATHRIVSLDRHLVQNGSNSAWAICVCFEGSGTGRPPAEGKRGKIDYREVLDEADFAVYARLRSLRKEIAEREGVPAYALFTNEQMAAMVQRRVNSVAALREISGVGDARVEKYAEPFLVVLRGVLGAKLETGQANHEA